MTARGRKARVDFVEVGEIDDDGGPPDDGLLADPAPGAMSEEPMPGPRGWRRIRRAWPIALVAVFVAGAYLVSGLRERAAFAALQDVLRGQEGFVADLGPELTPLWSFDEERGWAYPLLVDETLLLIAESDSGAALVAFDVDTDAELWRVEHAPGAGVTYCGHPFVGGDVTEGVVGCIHQRYEVTGDGEGEHRELEVQRRDVRTGEIRDSRDMLGAAYAVPWRDAILLVESDASGTWLRLEGFDGTQRWTLPLFDDSLDEGEYVALEVWGDRGLVTGRDRALVVDFDGTVVIDWSGTADAPDVTLSTDPQARHPELGVRLVAGGWIALTHWAQTTSPTQVFDEQGDLAYELDGRPESIRLDDGLAGDVLAWRTHDGVVLADRITGEVVFQFDRPMAGSAFVLDGALVFGDGGRLRSVDLATGEERWSVISGGSFEASDATIAVVLEHDGASSWLRALDLGSGRELWRRDLTDPYQMVTVVGGALYVHDAGTLSRLGR